MFQAVKTDIKFPKLEDETLAFWKQNRIYERSLELRKKAPAFVFFEGPPTANGMPHPGHCLTRAIKDLFPRYQTMRGYRCERKACTCTRTRFVQPVIIRTSTVYCVHS